MAVPLPRSRLASLLVAAWIAAPAAAQELPPELQGVLDVAVERCEAGPHGSGLLRATVRVRTGAAEIRLPELQCGAFVPGRNEALFLNTVDGGERVPPYTTRRLEAHFPGDARHTECRCVVSDVRQLAARDGAWHEHDDRAAEWWRRLQRAARRAPRAFAGRGAPETPDGVSGRSGEDAASAAGRAARPTLPYSTAPRLRREWVVRPDARLRAERAASTETSLALAAGQPLEVLALEAGAKQVRIATGETGWIDADASSPERRPPAAVAIALDALATAGDAAEPSFCRDRSDELRPLVFALLPEDRTAYVTPAWYLLDARQQDAFQVWTRDCYGIGRIVEAGRGLELRSHDWGDRPTLQLAAEPERATASDAAP